MEIIQRKPCLKHLMIKIDDVALASTHQAIMLIERNYPVRYYIPRADVDMNKLSLSPTQTFCPHKGEATYYSFGNHDDVAWSYESPFPQQAEIAGALCFAQNAWLTWPEGAPPPV